MQKRLHQVWLITICSLQILEKETDSEARFRSLVAVGTLVSKKSIHQKEE